MRVVAWIRRRRSIGVVAGIILVLVPTLFTVFPDWGISADSWIKGGVLVVWFVAAAFVVFSGVLQGEQIAALAGGALRREEHGRQVATEKLVHAVLLPDATLLAPYWETQVFLPNTERTRLFPYFDPSHAGPAEGWAINQDPGQGATGAAWTSNSLVFAFGNEVSDTTYGLTPEQQQQYRDLTAVVATPIQNAESETFGVLTLATKEQNPEWSDEVAEKLIGAAEMVARVLIEIGRVIED